MAEESSLIRKLEQGYNFFFPQKQKIYRAKIGEKSQNKKKIEKEGIGIFHSSVC